MTNKRYSSRAWLVLMLVGLTLAGIGCQTNRHEKNKQAALERWQEARGGVLYSVALQEFEVGDLDKARRTLSQAMSQDQDNPRFHALAGRIALERGELERAQIHLADALSIQPEYPEALYLQGVIFQRWQQYEQAYQAYHDAYQAKPDDVSGLLAAAEMLTKLDRSDEAVQMLEAKLVYFEHNAAIRTTLARIHMRADRVDKAVKLLRDAHVLAPEDPAILEHLAMAEYAADMWNEAGYHLSRLLEHADYAERSDLKKALAECYESTGESAKARRLYLELTEANPKDVQSWIKLGQAAWIVGDDARLRRAAERAVELAPARHEGYLLRGMVLSRIDRLDAALDEFDKAIDRAPEKTTPRILKGMVLQQAGRLPEAAELYEQATEINPDDARARRLLAGVDTAR